MALQTYKNSDVQKNLPVDNAVYQRAEQFLPWRLQHTIHNTTIFPYWTDEALYYFSETSTGKFLIRVDISSGKKDTILSYEELLKILSLQMKDSVSSEQLPLDKFFIQENPRQLFFTHMGQNWCYDFEKSTCTQRDNIPNEHLISPDRQWEIWTEKYNLFLNDLVQKQTFQITKDGKQYYDYATSPETNTHTITNRLENVICKPVAIWSPDSHKIITHKLDQQKVQTLFILQNAPPESQRPVMHSYHMSFSGDSHLPLAELVVIDVLKKTIIPLKIESLLSPYLTPIEFEWVWWSNDSEKVYFLRESRGSKELSLCVANAMTGITDILITEKFNTYIEPSQLIPWTHQVKILEDSKEIIWLSERSGYAHLYLYDYDSGHLKNAITQGEWCVREVHFYDSKNKWLYFTATGFDKKIDPYFKQFFRCRLDGSELQCLANENANHTIHFSPKKNCFLDTYSTINTAPVSILKNLDGKLICDIEVADLNGLKDLGWVPPKRFSVKARDGVTNIYGNLYFPSHFDAKKKYPIIDHIYPGPQVYRTPTHFSLYGAIFRSAWTAQALAELGFIVMHVDGLGTPGRSKAFHDATYKNMSDCGIPDHVAALKQLAAEHDFIDIERVGITGYSGGGYAAMRAMLTYPDFFKVAVAAAGNHDLRCYPASYGEKYNSLDVNTYESQSNAALAKNLKGKVLLVHGEMDDNVHPCATLQLVDALIKHNKDFDMLLMPNQNHHSTFDHPYYIRRHWDYFLKHLLGKSLSNNYIFSSIPDNFPQLEDW